MKFRTRACLGLVAAATLVATVALPASADALLLGGKKHVTSRDSVVTAKCQMSVSNIDNVHNTAMIHLQGSAQPSTLAGYRTNIFTEVVCTVTDADFTVFLGGLDATNNGPRVSGSVDLSVPLYSGYSLCGAALVRFRNGDEHVSPATCA
jgi:hypothetical protein